METFELNGTYGSGKTPCTVLCAKTSKNSNATWYAVEGSQNVNKTFDQLNNGVNVEELSDIDCFTWSKGINSLEELENAINA